MKVRVDRRLCRGIGVCERICPQIFQCGDGTCRAKFERVPREAESACREAADNCPNRAVILE